MGLRGNGRGQFHRQSFTTRLPALRSAYCWPIHAYVFSMPVRRGMLGSQSRMLRMNVLSLLRPATPLGAFGSYVRFSLTPAISSTMLTRSLTEISSLDP